MSLCHVIGGLTLFKLSSAFFVGMIVFKTAFYKESLLKAQTVKI